MYCIPSYVFHFAFLSLDVLQYVYVFTFRVPRTYNICVATRDAIICLANALGNCHVLAINSDIVLSSCRDWFGFQPKQGSLAISLYDDNYLLV